MDDTNDEFANGATITPLGDSETVFKLRGKFPGDAGVYQLNGTLDALAAVVTDMQNALKARGAVTNVQLRAAELTMITTVDQADGTVRIYLADEGEGVLIEGTAEEIDDFRQSMSAEVD